MLHPMHRFEGFDDRDWRRLLSLWRGDTNATKTPQGVVLVHDGQRVRKAIRSDFTIVESKWRGWPPRLDRIAKRHNAPWVIAVQRGALEQLAELIASRTKRQDDMLDQVLTAWRAARELVAAGRVATWPGRWTALPIPSRSMLLGAVGMACPANRALVLAAWDREALWTSLAIQRGKELVEWVLGPEHIRSRLGEFAGLRAAHACLMEAVREQMGAAAFGVSADKTIWAQMVDGATKPGWWASAVGRGEIIVDPLPAGMAIPIAIDATRVAYVLARGLVHRMWPGAGSDGELAAAVRFADAWQAARMLLGARGSGRG